MNRLYLSILLVCIPSFSLFAQTLEIDTDRPSITETTTTVPKNKFQVEAGFLHQQESDNGYTLSLPTVLWKYGVLNNMEVRLTTELGVERYDGNTLSGINPVTIGAKLNLWKEQDILPETSIIAQVQLNKIASEDLQLKNPAPALSLLFKNTITSGIDIGYNLGTEWDGDTGMPNFQYSVCPNFKLGKSFKAFVESYGYFTDGQQPEHWADAGLQYLITKNIQIDIAGGYELIANDSHHGFFETVGFSVQI